MLRHSCIVIVLVLFSSVAGFAADGDGGYAATFLQVPIGARPAAMGGAYIAVADDGAGVMYNPAGIANLKKNLFSSSYRAMQLDRTLGYATLIFSARGNSAVGFNWLYAGSGSVMARNQDGDALGHELTQHSHDFSVLFAKRFETFMSLGMRASYVHTSFAEMSTGAVAVDLGVMLYVNYLYDREKRDLMPIQDIQVGLVVRNLGANFRYNNESYYTEYSSAVFGVEQQDDIPWEIGLGGSARFFERKLVLAADAVKNKELNIAFHGGAEYFVNPQLALRSGYSDKRFTAGTGYNFKFSGWNLALDYAFSTDRVDEGSEHIFSFDLLF